MRIFNVRKSQETLLSLKNSCLENLDPSEEIFSQIDLSSEAFCGYIVNNLLPDWELANEIYNSQVPFRVNPTIKDLLPETTLVIAKHYNDQGKNSIVDAYQIFIWIEGKGIGATEIFKTDLHHSARPLNYILDLSFVPTIISLTEDFLVVEFLIDNYVQPWRISDSFLFGWRKGK